MNSQAMFLLGVMGGAAAVVAGSQAIRRRHAIDFAGRVVVITGGSRGLGLVLARQLAAEGARLCLLARAEAELARARDELLDSGAEVMTLRCDVRRRADVRAAVDRILERWSRVDVLINNAGVIQVGPLEHMTPEDFENSMATHFWGPLHMMYEIVPEMRRRGFGRIVNISSIGGRVAVPHLAPYCAGKFALAGLSDAVRAELNQYGVRVTTVAPGLMRTGSPMNADMKGQHEAEYAWFAISSSLPGLSISADAAARQIVEACRHGDPELTITLQARLAVMLTHVAPGVVGRMMMIANRFLPGPAGVAGDRHRKGRESESKWAPSAATILTNRAAAANNEW
ncbi:MAG: SDR family NAD(P)-dependent oxidoreductase [Acidobacteria bacterium]|nr:SDR family NAD(P)-dependent oxidoreductase [Acidobacteriota bacterium]MBA3887264.1 SDR family NAD(P)-dependent oxidoreductase [Acidobacteriota bacterium]